MSRSQSSRKSYHVVRITAEGYSLLGSYEDPDEAIGVALTIGCRIDPLVLRDGRSGRRYSLAQLEGGVNL